MKLAIEEARKSVPEDKRAHPKVGAVVVKNGRALATAYRSELSEGEHAEFAATERKLQDETIAGATVYTTLEPCTTRNHPKVPCAKLLIERKVERVVIGMLDPNPNICGKGERLLREHGIVVDRFPHALIVQLEELNRDFTRAPSRAAGPRSDNPQAPAVGPPPESGIWSRGQFSFSDTVREVLDNGYVVRWSCYVRLRVVNVGTKAAKNCRGYLTQVEWQTANGNFGRHPTTTRSPHLVVPGKGAGIPCGGLVEGNRAVPGRSCHAQFPESAAAVEPKG